MPMATTEKKRIFIETIKKQLQWNGLGHPFDILIRNCRKKNIDAKKIVSQTKNISVIKGNSFLFVVVEIAIKEWNVEIAMNIEDYLCGFFLSIQSLPVSYWSHCGGEM